jgi:hypothetical protein
MKLYANFIVEQRKGNRKKREEGKLDVYLDGRIRLWGQGQFCPEHTTV